MAKATAVPTVELIDSTYLRLNTSVCRYCSVTDGYSSGARLQECNETQQQVKTLFDGVSTGQRVSARAITNLRELGSYVIHPVVRVKDEP